MANDNSAGKHATGSAGDAESPPRDSEGALRGEKEGDGSRRLDRAGVQFDITDRTPAETALEASEARLQLALDSAAMGTWEWDPQTNLSVWDRREYALLGIDPAETATFGRLLHIVHPDDREELIRRVRVAIDEARDLDVDFRIYLPDGSIRWLAGKGRGVYENGRIVRMIGTNFDVTERKLAEQAKVAAEAAQRANRAKTEFLSHMSHELRTPLNAVLGFAQLIEMGVKPELDRARAGQIVTAGRHLLAMINDVLDLARIEVGQLALSVERIDAGACLAESIALVRAMAAEAQVALNAPAPAPGMTFVRADTVRLRQVVVNVLTNAIKYNVPGGRVAVSLSRAGNDVRIAVADTGRGLTAEQRAHLFEPFNRLGAEKSRVEGTGIGLTVARDLVRLMNGRIEVESEPGHGSIFTIVMPCDAPIAAPAPGGAPAAAPAAAPASDAPAAAHAGAAPKHDVLYVEDNEINVLVAQHALAMLTGIELRIACSGADALAAVRARRPDLVLLDMNLGDMLGTEVKAQLDAEPATAGIPCMAVSADAQPEQISQARAQGFVDYVTKPFDVDDLLRRVEAALQKGGRR